VIWGSSFGAPYSIGELITNILNVYPQDLEGDSILAQQLIPGDFAISGDPRNSDVQKLSSGLATLLTEAMGHKVTLTFRQVQRPIIVLRGKWQARNTDGTQVHFGKGEFQIIQIYGLELNPNHACGGGGSGTVDQFAQWLGRWINRSVIIESTGAPAEVSWNENGQVAAAAQAHAHDWDLVLNNIYQQTGLIWKQETRKVNRLFLEQGK
jgi:hypothetical protein